MVAFLKHISVSFTNSEEYSDNDLNMKKELFDCREMINPVLMH